MGAAYGTAKSGTGIAAMSVMRPDLIMKSVIPVVMAGIIAIYGLVVSVLIANKRKLERSVKHWIIPFDRPRGCSHIIFLSLPNSPMVRVYYMRKLTWSVKCN